MTKKYPVLKVEFEGDSPFVQHAKVFLDNMDITPYLRDLKISMSVDNPIIQAQLCIMVKPEIIDVTPVVNDDG